MNDLCIFIIQKLLEQPEYQHPDKTAFDTWKKLNELPVYHGTLRETLRLMARN